MAETNLKTIDETLDELYDELTSEEETEDEGGDPESTDDESDGNDTDIVADDESGDTADEEVEQEEEPEEEVEEEQEKAEEIEEEFRNPPTTWTAQSKSQYRDLPAWAKREIHKRERDALNGVNNLKGKAEFADRLNSTIQPYQPFLRSMGVTPERAVEDALNLAHSLKTGTPVEKAMILRNIAQQYGVDIKQVQEAQQIDPQYAQLMGEVQRLRRDQFQQQQLTQQQQMAEANRQIEEFLNETDENGELAHPYFSNVSMDMKVLIESGRATTLKDAYEKACWADPGIRELIQSKQLAEKEAQRRENEKQKILKAKKSNRNNLEHKGKSDFRVKPKGTIEDTISETYDRLMAEG